MMDVSKRDGWQFVDEKLNLIYPWYTKPFLNVLESWDLSDKLIFEYGIGYSTVWFANHVRQAVGIDDSLSWVAETSEYLERLRLDKKVFLRYVKVLNESQYFIDAYTKQVVGVNPDIIVIDGLFRDECIPVAIENIKEGGIIICDNWMQEEVWVCKCPELLTKYEHYVFKQEGHPFWQTAYFIIKQR